MAKRLAKSSARKAAKGSAKTVARKGAKKATRKAAKKAARKAGRRELLKTPTMTAFAKRDAEGQFSEMDDVGRSLAVDRRHHAKRTVTAGHGDQGDQPLRKRTAKKR